MAEKILGLSIEDRLLALGAETPDQWMEAHRHSDVACLTRAVTVNFPVPTLDQLDVFNDLVHVMSEVFGGATVFDGEGLWCDTDAGPGCPVLVREKVKVIQSAHNCSDRKGRERFTRALTEAMRKTNQTSLGIRGTGAFHVIPTKLLTT